MGSPNAEALLALAESIADGAPVDWAAAEARTPAADQAVIRQLRILSNLAGLHRSLPADPVQAVSPARSVAAPAIGSWAHLVLVERLGGGTSGDVYRAWDRHLEREVALKLLRGDEAVGDLHASRITMEGRLLARVHHANVITVHGVDVHDRRVGLWMELVRGVTLEQQLADHGPLSAREAALVGIDLCHALAAIHAAGLIHRDVKAQNVMREDGGRIVLMDLGTSREAGALRASTAPDLAGTPLYLAPEIFSGAAASERTDLYSLGVLLYHLVTGAFPVRATTMKELQERHRARGTVRLRDARADLPTGFVRVVERAIAADPEERYATAGAFEADLVGALRDTAQEPVAIDPTPHSWTWVPRAGILLAALAAVVAIAAVLWPASRGWRAPATVVPGAIRSIAVLPLVNLSGDPAQEYFVDGMTDELIGTLGEIAGVNVISRTSAMQFKGSKKTAPEIAKILHVDAVLEGTVLMPPAGGAGQRDGANRIRIRARLIHAGTDTQLWDKAFETVVADILSLQSQVVNAVAEGIHLRLTSTPVARPTQDFQSFDLYLRGRYYWNARTEEGLKRSIQYFQEAIDRTPRFATAYAGLADAYNLLGDYGFVPRAEARARAVAAATKALELDDSVAEAYVSLAFIDDDEFRWEAAEDRFKRALALKPGYVTGHHWYAYHLVQRGRFDEAIAEGSKAVELDPLSIGTIGQLGTIFLYARQYDRAIAQLEKTVQMDPNFARGRSELAKAYLLTGQRDRGRAEADKGLATASRDAIVIGDIGYVYALTGRQREARRIAAELVGRYRLREDGAALAAAIVFAGLGDLNQTFGWLDAARDPLDPQLAGFKVDPRCDRVREDARFAKLLATVGLSQ